MRRPFVVPIAKNNHKRAVILKIHFRQRLVAVANGQPQRSESLPFKSDSLLNFQIKNRNYLIFIAGSPRRTHDSRTSLPKLIVPLASLIISPILVKLPAAS